MKKRIILLQLTAPVQSANASTAIFVPLALGLLKAQAIKEELCPQHYDIEILDRKICLNFGDKRLVDYITASRPEAIGFSCYGWNILRSQFLARKIKQHVPGVKIIFGGPEAGPRSTELMEATPEIDFVVKGEGEFAFTQILRELLGERDYSHIRGLTYRSGSTIVSNQEACPIEDLNSIASPYLYNTFNLKDYDELVFETSRGCPFRCSYCYYGGGRNTVKYFSLERVAKELELIKMQGGPRLCEFADSNFNIPSRLETLYEVLKKVNHDHYFRFRAEINPEFVDERQIEIFRELNVTEIEIGVQSTNKAELNSIHRRFDEAKVSRSIELIKNSGIACNFHLIIGLPKQTKESFAQSYDYLIRQGVGDKVNSFLLQVLPGTDLRKRSEELGLVYSKFPPYIISETADLGPSDIRELIDLRGKYIVEHQIQQQQLDQATGEVSITERSIENPELLRFNSYLNLSYSNVDHDSRLFSYQESNKLASELKLRALSRIVIEDELLEQEDPAKLVPNHFTGVFNQIYFRIGNKEGKAGSICSILKTLFHDNPYVCTDIVIDSNTCVTDEEVNVIYRTLAQVFLPFNYVEIERTRKRIELINILSYSASMNQTLQPSKHVTAVYRVYCESSLQLKAIIQDLLSRNLQAALFKFNEIIDWNIILDMLDEVYLYNQRNNYVFFENIALQQFYLKNYVYKHTPGTKFTKYPFGHHDGELTLVCGSNDMTLISASTYPYE